MEAHISCVACTDKITENPCVLPCGDIYCKKCINTLEYKIENKTMHKCKNCNLCFHNLPNDCKYFNEFLQDFNETKVPNEELLQCSVCLDILWKPVIPTCGHWICFWCFERSGNSCPLCRSDIIYRPKICTKLHEFILHYFPDNADRIKDDDISSFENFRIKEVDPSERTREGLITRVAGTLLNNYQCEDLSSYSWVHVCCDGCGQTPIVGEKVYCCMDCYNIYGFDLCEHCYLNEKMGNVNTETVGLYEQVHNPETHTLLCITPDLIRSEIARAREQYGFRINL